jgi:YD repeat-containing protein
MRKQERVKYIQKVILGPLPNASEPAQLQMTPSASSLRATTESTPPTWKCGTYRYDMSGNIYAIGLANDDTGSTVQHRYAYDELSRLKRADTITASTHTETFTYDPYGKRTEHLDGTAVTSTPVQDPNTNRLAWSTAHPYSYDAAGNLTADYNATYAHDPFNMLREKDYGSKQEFYIYTAGDERIGVKYGTSTTCAWSAMQLMRTCVAVAFTCVIGLVGCRSGSVPQNAPEPTTLCSIAGKMEAFTSKTVVLSAVAINDMMHLTLLVDQACTDQTMALQFPEQNEDPSVGAFRAVLFAADSVAGPNRRVNALFTGIVNSWPDRVPSRVLLLKRVENVKVTE